MFGTSKLRDKITELEDAIMHLHTEIESNSKVISSFSDRGSTLIKHAIDSKSDISAIRHQMQSMQHEIAHVRETTEKYEDILDAFLESRYEKDEAMKQILLEFIEKQNMMFDFVQGLEELLETTETIMEELKPEKKIPKLPKSETATN